MAAPRVLVTRPAPQGERTAAKLEALGYAPVLAPMLRIAPITPAPDIDLSGIQAVLATSRNGIEAFAQHCPRRDIPVLAVGTGTEQTARAFGFRSVQSADGDAESLATLANRTLDPDRGGVLHVRGRDIARPLAPLLNPALGCREIVLYEALQVAELPEAALEEPFHAVLVYSARTAEALGKAMTHASVDPASIRVIGISEAALAPLTRFAPHRIAADSPDEAAVLQALSVALPLPAKN